MRLKKLINLRLTAVRVLVVISVFLGFTLAHNGNSYIANQFFLKKQEFLLEILLHVEDPLLNKEWLYLGQSLALNVSDYVSYNAEMTYFHRAYITGKLLPRDSYYTPLNAMHLEEATGLFYYLYNARDWATLQQNICWARMHVNPGMFVYTLTQTLMKRVDFAGLIMPKIYEILPQHFMPQQFVQQAERYDYGMWRMAEVRQHTIREREENNTVERFSGAYKWQWWWRAVPKFNIDQDFRPSALQGVRNTNEWILAMREVRSCWMPTDYSRAILTKETQRHITYLTEDVGWNAYWYYANMALMQWQDAQTDVEVNVSQMRDWWFWKRYVHTCN